MNAQATIERSEAADQEQRQAQSAPPSERPEQPQASDEARTFLESYAAEHMTTDERVTAYVLVRLALKDRAMADAVKSILWEHVGFCFEDVAWHEQVEREDSPETVRDIQTVLNFWRKQTETAESEKEQAKAQVEPPAVEAPAEQPKPEKKRPWKENIEDASDTEKIVVNWLLKQSYATKLACVIMEIWLNGDHNTDGITGDILSRWTDEIQANVKNPPEGLSLEEAAMSGVAAEAEVWRENL